jgi:hypothetical protein
MNRPDARFRRATVCTAVIVASCAVAAQFIPSSPFGFDRGQDVSPTFDGWVRNADGTFSLYFGYLNRNAAEEIQIPIGPENRVDPGGDRGQPSYFYPSGSQEPAGLQDRDVTGRRRWWAFKVDVPKDWTDKQRLSWILTSRGRTNQAVAWLQPEYEVTADFIRQNAADGHLFSRGQFDTGNRPPSISGSATQSATGTEATLMVTATDDGRPEPAGQQTQARRQTQGLRIRWITYRGPARVKFDPETQGPFEATSAKAETRATFSVPGSYRLRAIASDGQLYSVHDTDITVSPRPAVRTAR